jgi:hypothetical protein
MLISEASPARLLAKTYRDFPFFLQEGAWLYDEEFRLDEDDFEQHHDADSDYDYEDTSKKKKKKSSRSKEQTPKVLL